MKRNLHDLSESSVMTNVAAGVDESCCNLYWCFHMLKLTLTFAISFFPFHESSRAYIFRLYVD